MNAIDYGLAVWMVTHPWIMLAAAITASLIALFIIAISRGVAIVNAADDLIDGPADEMAPEMRARFDAFRRHADEAMHVANDCVMCEFDRNRAPRKDGKP